MQSEFRGMASIRQAIGGIPGYPGEPWQVLMFPERVSERVSGFGFLFEEIPCLTDGHTEDGGDAQSCYSKYEYG